MVFYVGGYDHLRHNENVIMKNMDEFVVFWRPNVRALDLSKIKIVIFPFFESCSCGPSMIYQVMDYYMSTSNMLLTLHVGMK